MKSLRDVYHDTCTLRGILKSIHAFAGCLVNAYFVIAMLLFFLLLSGCYYIIFTQDMHFLSQMLCILTVPFMTGFIVMLSVTSVYHNLVISLLKKYYQDILAEAALKMHDKKKFRDRILYPLYTDNEYHIILDYIIKEQKMKFERAYRLNPEVIAVLQAMNQRDLEIIGERLQAKSNLAFYAFIGGLLLEKFTDSLYKQFDNPMSILLMLAALVLIIRGMKIVYCRIDKVIINGADTREITRIQEFTTYLYEKELEYKLTWR